MALKQMYIEVELLYDDEVTSNPVDMTLSDLEYEFTEGSISAKRRVRSLKTLSKKQMAKSLIRQGSDPDFLTADGDMIWEKI